MRGTKRHEERRSTMEARSGWKRKKKGNILDNEGIQVRGERARSKKRRKVMF